MDKSQDDIVAALQRAQKRMRTKTFCRTVELDFAKRVYVVLEELGLTPFVCPRKDGDGGT